MSSDLQSVLQLLQMNNYVSLIIVTAVVYDYLLTFSREIDYVWHRSWTWVSTMFVLVRYLGLCFAVLNSLVGSTFVPGPVRFHSCAIMYLVPIWAFEIFYIAADYVMILRVYAMWNRSKGILWALLFIYVPQVICSFVLAGIFNNPNTHLSFTVVQLINFSFCNAAPINIAPLLYVYSGIPRFILCATLFVLAVVQTLKQSVDMYKATKHWEPNLYMQHLVRDGILYFLVNVLYNIAAIVPEGVTITSTSLLFLTVFSYIAFFPMMPRFIIGVREMYDRDPRRGCQGIDTGFGVLSQPIVIQNAAVSAIAFVDVPPEQEQVVEWDASELEAIRLEPLGDGTRQV